MKVLHVIWDVGQGGAQKYLLDLLNGLRLYDDIENYVLVLSGEGSLSGEVAASCSAVTYIGMASGSDLLSARKLLVYLARLKVDLIHSHSNTLLLNVLFQFSRIPVIYTEHGGCLLNGRLPDRMIYKYLYRPIKRFIAISEYMASEMKAENPVITERIRVVYNGSDISALENATPVTAGELGIDDTDRSPRVGFIGRLTAQKGVELFLDCARLVLAKRSDVRFFIVGDGEEREALQKKADADGISGSVQFLGYQKNSAGFLKAFDLLLFTSRFEPFGLVLTEAMAAGVPVVALDIRGAVAEVIRPGIDGIVVSGDSCEEAANGVLSILDNADLRQTYVSEAGTRVRQEFTIERNASRIRNNYLEICPG